MFYQAEPDIWMVMVSFHVFVFVSFFFFWNQYNNSNLSRTSPLISYLWRECCNPFNCVNSHSFPCGDPFLNSSLPSLFFEKQ